MSFFPTLTDRNAFLFMNRKAQRAPSRTMVLQFTPASDIPDKWQPQSGDASSPTSEPSIFGLTVSKKCGNAVKRNRIKRRLRALLQDNLKAGQPVRPGCYVIIARHTALSAPFSQLQQDFAYCLRKLERPTKPHTKGHSGLSQKAPERHNAKG